VPAILRRARWVMRAPRTAVRLWQAVSAAWLASLVMLALTFAQRLLERLAWPQDQPPITPRELILAVLGLGLAAATIARASWVIAREVAWARRQRRSHLLALELAGQPAAGLNATFIDHDIPAVYSLPAPDAPKAVTVRTG